ncbi:AAA family ATPase [Sphingomonas sp. AR_OL41]|uniref:AAA family ATPase n=1 Tax=Sphingomonas sp. AR_OL41 TaxID=3042729 RepID=UPI0024811EBD|nr:AAA family ATPase [Sphingomonas sp. AR_OL41]MDH7974400.1 AAA family ATPase [Sphingomonas sp. AR_OL41]
MTKATHLVALLQSHLDGDDEQFLTVAMQAAANEARQGHGKLAQQLRDMVDGARAKKSKPSRAVPLVQPRGELANLVAAKYVDTRLSGMVLPGTLRERLERVIVEQRQAFRLRQHGLRPRRKLLLIGPPGAGKTMTAAAMAGELRLPLFSVLLDGLLTKFMGETASKLRTVFAAMAETRGVYFFDEFDAIGARRSERNDVGEIRRVLNSFLQFLEEDESEGLIIAATNHPELLDPALFRRFDDVIEYALPNLEVAREILKARLSTFDTHELDWTRASTEIEGLSQADLSRIADEAAKQTLLDGRERVETKDLLAAIAERRAAARH